MSMTTESSPDSDILKMGNLNKVGVISSGNDDILRIVKRKVNNKYILSKSADCKESVTFDRKVDVNPNYDRDHVLREIPATNGKNISIKKPSKDKRNTKKSGKTDKKNYSDKSKRYFSDNDKTPKKGKGEPEEIFSIEL